MCLALEIQQTFVKANVSADLSTFSATYKQMHALPRSFPEAWSHLFEVILPPLVTVGDMQGVQVFQWTSVISEGHLGYPLQDLVELLLTLGLEKQQKNKSSHTHRPPLWRTAELSDLLNLAGLQR